MTTKATRIEHGAQKSGPHMFIPPLDQVFLLTCIYGGLAVVAAYLAKPELTSAAIGAALAMTLIYLSTIDVAFMRLPDALTMPLLAVGLAMAALAGADTFLWHAVSAALGFGAFWGIASVYEWLRGVAGLGMGDAKFLGAAGAWIGAEQLPVLVMIAALTALAFAALAALRGRGIDRAARLPFGPFLAIGLWCVWLFGPISY